MPWVRFRQVFDWDPPERRGRTTLAFAAGSVVCVRTECAKAAIAAGAAVKAKRPRDGDGDGDAHQPGG